MAGRDPGLLPCQRRTGWAGTQASLSEVDTRFQDPKIQIIVSAFITDLSQYY